MNLLLDELFVEKLKVSTMVTAKKNAGTQYFVWLFFVLVFLGQIAIHFQDEFAQGLLESFFETTIGEVGCSDASIFGFHIPVRRVAHGASHAIGSFV